MDASANDGAHGSHGPGSHGPDETSDLASLWDALEALAQRIDERDEHPRA